MKLSTTTGVLERRFGFDGAVKLIAGAMASAVIEGRQGQEEAVEETAAEEEVAAEETEAAAE